MLDRIEALHELGFLHMDIKTENVLVGSSDYKSVLSSTLKMIDFGLT
jgi:serine/threonine protein kinase